jgi:hypothetical protein
MKYVTGNLATSVGIPRGKSCNENTGQIYYFHNVGFEVFTAVVMKNSVFWDVTTCSPSKATCFRTGVLLGLFFDHEGGGYMFFQNVGWLSTDFMALYPIRYHFTFMF